jgi:hypothetical protein
MPKTVAIPAHITDSSDKTGYYNLVQETGLAGISRNGDDMLISNITTPIIRNILGEDNVDIIQLCQSANINPYSFYKPNGSAPYSFGDFAGYDKNAMPPTYYASHPTIDAVQIQEITSGVYGIQISTILRRGEALPLYNPAVDSWNNIKVVFQLREATGGGGGLLLATSTIENINVLKMFSSTLVTSDWLTWTTPAPFPNATTDYRVQIHAYYTYGGSDVAIEDGSLAYTITANEYIPAAPPTYDLYVYAHNGHNIEPVEETNSFGEGVYSMPSDKDASYSGDLRCHYLYKPTDGSYPTEWIGYAYGQYIPAGTESADAILVTMAGGSAIGLVDKTHSRYLTMEYYNSAGWQEFYNHTFPAE